MIKFNTKTTLFLIAIFILLSLCLNAKDEMSTLFGGDKKIRTGGYGAFEIKFSQLNEEFGGLFLGGRGGVILNNVFSIGGAGYGLVPTKKIKCPIVGHENEKNNFWTGGYGGLFFEYINSSNSLTHFTTNILIGAGGITYVNHNSNFNFYGLTKHPSSFIWVIEPGIGVELNVAKIFRMYLGASYRYAPNFKLIADNDKEVVSSTAFNAISINLAFKFGNFRGYTHEERERKIKKFLGVEEE